MGAGVLSTHSREPSGNQEVREGLLVPGRGLASAMAQRNKSED